MQPSPMTRTSHDSAMVGTPSTPTLVTITLVGGLLIAGLLFTAVPSLAGGQLESTNFSGDPGPQPGTLAVDFAKIRWDDRCLPPAWVHNTVEAPRSIPALTAAEVREVMQAGFDAWNEIPTSYIDMQMSEREIVRAPTNPFDFTAYDFVNEINFAAGVFGPGFFAISPSTSLTADSYLVAGLDLDGDGDSDVFDPAVEGRETCADVDGDGDHEFPAGFYRAGTILENDVSFNNLPVAWTVGPPTNQFGEADMEGIAAHEFGHSHGLSHSAFNQFSATDGNPATMIPGIPSNDVEGQLAMREPSSDDVAWSSYVYPEGRAAEGPAALQPGDVAFDDAYAVISGDMTHGRTGLPLVGGHLYAVERDTGRIVSGTLTGRARWGFDPAAGFFLDFSNPAYHLPSGGYELPVPVGEYHLAIEPMDGPVAGFSVSATGQTGLLFNLQDFSEAFLRKPGDRAERLEVEAEAGGRPQVDHTTADDLHLEPFDRLGFIAGNIAFDIDNVRLDFVPRTFYAVRFPAAEVLALLDTGLEPKGADFRTWVIDSAVVPIFQRAAIVAGRDGEGGVELDLDDPLFEEEDFVGQENEYSPLRVAEPDDLAERIREAIEDDGADAIYLVVETSETFAGPRGFPLTIGTDFGQISGLLGRSYVSTDGGESFVQDAGVNYMFRFIFGASEG